MFTGIIQSKAEVEDLARVREGLRVRVSVGDLDLSDTKIGDSVAVNGACLTVVAIEERSLMFDVSEETIECTLISTWQVGERVNIELAMLASTRFGGHIVSGHVDGLATISRCEEGNDYTVMWLVVDSELAKFIAKKGSVCIDGVSLTVNEVNGKCFRINIIPHTLKVTSLNNRTNGDRVHIEIDLIARYVARLLDATTDESLPGADEKQVGVTMGALKASGFLD